jgi:hypothetical protein
MWFLRVLVLLTVFTMLQAQRPESIAKVHRHMITVSESGQEQEDEGPMVARIYLEPAFF